LGWNRSIPGPRGRLSSPMTMQIFFIFIQNELSFYMKMAINLIAKEEGEGF
jgi:hypothetical protein